MEKGLRNSESENLIILKILGSQIACKKAKNRSNVSVRPHLLISIT